MRLGSLRLYILTQVVVCFDSSGFDSGGCITNTIVGDHITVEAIMSSRMSLDRESTNAVMEEAISAEYSSARPSMFRSAMITDTAVLYAIGSSCFALYSLFSVWTAFRDSNSFFISSYV